MASEPTGIKDIGGLYSGKPDPGNKKVGYRRLRPEELETLREELEKFDTKMTKISPEETKLKKEIVDWLLDMLKSEIKPKNRIHKLFKAGSAYEKVQAGEANDFDVMVFLNVRQGIWEVEDTPGKPGFCSIKLTRLRPPSEKETLKKKSISTSKSKYMKRSHPLIQLLDGHQRLSALKIRKLFTSSVDKILKKKAPLIYTSKSNPKQTGTVKVTRRQRGPATTLTIECDTLKVAPFTLDLVNSLHSGQMSRKANEKQCDFVAKPYDKREAFSMDGGHLWRKSYSREEIKIMRQIDEGNQIHRKMLRIFKIIKSHQSQLKCLKSYIYKNVLLLLAEGTKKTWSEKDLAERFVDMVIALRDCLAARELPVFCNPKINLLSEYKECQLTRIMGYLRRIANKGLEGYMELLALKEKSHMENWAKRKKPRKRLRKSKLNIPKKKLKRMTLQELLAAIKKQKADKRKINHKFSMEATMLDFDGDESDSADLVDQAFDFPHFEHGMDDDASVDESLLSNNADYNFNDFFLDESSDDSFDFVNQQLDDSHSDHLFLRGDDFDGSDDDWE